MDIDLSKLVPTPTRPSKSDLQVLKQLAGKLPQVTDKRTIETSGAKLLKQGFTQFDNGTEIKKGIRYKFDILVPVDHSKYLLSLFKRFGLPGAQAYVEFVKQVFIAQLKHLEESGVTSVEGVDLTTREADQLPGPPPDENNPT